MGFCKSDQKSMPVVGLLTCNDCDVLRAKAGLYRQVTPRTIILPTLSTLLTRNHKKPTACYNCGESSHLRFDCDLSPWEVRMHHERKSHRPRQDGEEAKVAVHYAPESNSEDVLLTIY